jgi:histidine ammonia-lyase
MNGIVFFVFQSELQENLIRSHAAGVGRALTPQKTRMLLALRINVLAKGYSGISLTTLQQLIDAFNCKLLFFERRVTQFNICR